MTSSATKFRLVESPSDPAVAAFARLQEQVYYDSDTLIPGAYFPRLLAARSEQRRNLLLVAEREDDVVGGTLFHYLAEAGSGFSSFMGVRPDARGQGLARRLHEARFEALDASRGSPVPGVFIDVVAPERVDARELEQERQFGFEPLSRRRIFQSLGFCKVNIDYRQPVGGPGGGPLTTLDLLFCPREHGARSVPTQLVTDTLRGYWSPWLGEARTQRELERLRELASGPTLALVDAVSLAP